MKTMRASFAGKTQILLSLVLLLSLFSWVAAYAQITPLGDAYTNSADPTTKRQTMLADPAASHGWHVSEEENGSLLICLESVLKSM